MKKRSILNVKNFKSVFDVRLSNAANSDEFFGALERGTEKKKTISNSDVGSTL